MKEKVKILFINNGSIKDPIIESQGLPLLDFYANHGITCYFVSFENYPDEELHKKDVDVIKNKFSQDINYLEIILKPRKLLPYWFYFYYYGIRKIKTIIKAKRINIIHTRSFYPSIIGYLLIKYFKINAKLIYDNRGVFIEEEIFKGHWKRKGFKVLLFKYIEKQIVKRSDAIVVVSKKFKEYLNKLYSGISTKTFVIPNGTKINKQNINKNHRNLDKIVGVYSGSMTKWQNINGLINLVKEGTNLEFDIEFKIITYQLEKIEPLLLKSNVDLSRINLLVKKSSEVVSELTKSSFGILIREDNLVNNVASPIKFAEYLSAGLPVLISEGIGDTEEIIMKYKVGVILEGKNYKKALNEMIVLLAKKDIREKCVHAAQTELNIKNSFDIYYNVLNFLDIQ